MSSEAPSPREYAARIVPRVVVSEQGAIRIDQAVAEAIAAGVPLVELVGGPGSGKTTALRFLEDRLAGLSLTFFDADAGESEIRAAIERGRAVVVASAVSQFATDGTTLRLAPWGRDEIIEWAIGEPRETRGSFVERAMAGMDETDEDSPEVLAALWRVMCEDSGIRGLAAGVQAALRSRLGSDPEAMNVAADLGWKLIRGHDDLSRHPLNQNMPARRLIRHRSISLHLAAEFATRALETGSVETLRNLIPMPLLDRIAEQVRASEGAIRTLKSALGSPGVEASEAMAASILHAAGVGWRPDETSVPHDRNFQWARLAGVRWPGVRLVSADLTHADLRGADLSGADLARAKISHARLAGAALCGAQMQAIKGREADLQGAELAGATLDDAILVRSNLTWADLSRARARGAVVVNCDLRDVNLRGADLGQSVFRIGDLGETDLTGATFSSAILRDINLRLAKLDDVVLEQAAVRDCDLMSVLATGLNCRGAKFVNCDLTGSVLRCACFAGAKLQECGLAEIWWQGADLRGADLTGSTFHMGSSRCGLVGSTIAGEGSRTGFYTDDSSEQDYRPPEEIAKADLRGADLRGAKVEGVDFYLVDLRGAIYDQEQAEWFRKCGAILVARVE